jgi:ABC-type molybdate transport system substrate-binding protein
MVVGTRQVPIGAYTHAVFERLAPDTRKALNARIVSRESNVRLVRAKVLLGEADAAIGYRTDARIEGVRAVEIPAHLQPFVLYHLGWPSPSTPAAQQVLDFLKGPTGARILTAQGFIP